MNMMHENDLEEDRWEKKKATRKMKKEMMKKDVGSHQSFYCAVHIVQEKEREKKQKNERGYRRDDDEASGERLHLP